MFSSSVTNCCLVMPKIYHFSLYRHCQTLLTSLILEIVQENPGKSLEFP